MRADSAPTGDTGGADSHVEAARSGGAGLRATQGATAQVVPQEKRQ